MRVAGRWHKSCFSLETFCPTHNNSGQPLLIPHLGNKPTFHLSVGHRIKIGPFMHHKFLSLKTIATSRTNLIKILISSLIIAGHQFASASAINYEYWLSNSEYYSGSLSVDPYSRQVSTSYLKFRVGTKPYGWTFNTVSMGYEIKTSGLWTGVFYVYQGWFTDTDQVIQGSNLGGGLDLIGDGRASFSGQFPDLQPGEYTLIVTARWRADYTPPNTYNYRAGFSNILDAPSAEVSTPSTFFLAIITLLALAISNLSRRDTEASK
jgi:hypothetical protein